MLEDKDIFTRISNPDERHQLFEDLIKNKGLILCKGQADVILRLKPLQLHRPQSSVDCTPEEGTVTDNEDLLGHFFLGTEKYYFQARAVHHLKAIRLLLTDKVFLLQRRQNYRVRIPENYKAQFKISAVNGATRDLSGQILDLSSGGCRALYNTGTASLKIGDTISGQLMIAKRDPMTLSGLVRHLQGQPSDKSPQIVGLEFTSITPIQENRLFSLTMDLYREIFKRTF